MYLLIISFIVANCVLTVFNQDNDDDDDDEIRKTCCNKVNVNTDVALRAYYNLQLTERTACRSGHLAVHLVVDTQTDRQNAVRNANT